MKHSFISDDGYPMYVGDRYWLITPFSGLIHRRTVVNHVIYGKKEFIKFKELKNAKLYQALHCSESLEEVAERLAQIRRDYGE